jgi:hypothetical protein
MIIKLLTIRVLESVRFPPISAPASKYSREMLRMALWFIMDNKSYFLLSIESGAETRCEIFKGKQFAFDFLNLDILFFMAS